MTEDPLLSIRKKGVPCTDAERRPYVTIREKSGIIFTFKNKMKVRLCWNAADRDELTARDLDLCLFYRGEDGARAVFSPPTIANVSMIWADWTRSPTFCTGATRG